MESPYEPADGEHVLRDCRILIVEDHRDTAELVERAITNWLRVRCTVADCVAEAQRQFDAARAAGDEYHVVICDLLLPDGSGLDLPGLLRPGGRESGGARLIAISAMAAIDDEALSLEAGFDAHLRKPFTLQALVRVVNDLLNRTSCAASADA